MFVQFPHTPHSYNVDVLLNGAVMYHGAVSDDLIKRAHRWLELSDFLFVCDFRRYVCMVLGEDLCFCPGWWVDVKISLRAGAGYEPFGSKGLVPFATAPCWLSATNC